MKRIKVLVVRIYLTDSKTARAVLDYLKKETEIRGITVLRGISGFGDMSGHISFWVDWMFDLPITIEFFPMRIK